MIFYRGTCYENKEQSRLLGTLRNDCFRTLNQSPPLSRETVIRACDFLYRKVCDHAFDDIVLPLLRMVDLSYERFLEMGKLFSREGLEAKCRMELGENAENRRLPSGTLCRRVPLGILFHIAAGNVDALPAYSVVEGLLAGNVNILKLPTGDSGVSVRLLSELVKAEPALAEYIYVFDVPSTETETLKTFADIADAVVVWGGDAAVQAARTLCDVKTEIIAWGHKLSFAYASADTADGDLTALAEHICATNQTLCSSCQGIFVDTDDMETVSAFAKRFYHILSDVNRRVGFADVGMRGKNSIRIYNDLLENPNQTVYYGNGVSVRVGEDSRLELSYLFRDVWVKPLKRTEIVPALKEHKAHLQTCGLLCGKDDRPILAERLLRAGVTRVTGGDLSRMFVGEAHDGFYPLARYSRIAEIDP